MNFGVPPASSTFSRPSSRPSAPPLRTARSRAVRAVPRGNRSGPCGCRACPGLGEQRSCRPAARPTAVRYQPISNDRTIERSSGPLISMIGLVPAAAARLIRSVKMYPSVSKSCRPRFASWSPAGRAMTTAHARARSCRRWLRRADLGSPRHTARSVHSGGLDRQGRLVAVPPCSRTAPTIGTVVC